MIERLARGLRGRWRGGGDNTRVGIDLEQPVRVAGQAVGDRVIGRIQVEGIGRQADRGADDHILVDGIGRRIAVGRASKHRTRPDR